MVMASIEEMASAAGSAIVEAGGDVAEFLGMGDSAADVAKVADSTIDQLASGVSATSMAGGDSVFGGLKDWTMQALSKQMPGILKAAMTPKYQQRAPLGGSGHGVQASAGSNGSVINEVEGLAGGDPLQGLSGFKNLL
ncbi:hypothetical protein FDX19_15590 [Citrobacter sp. wls619]|uniref:hypothetical protein n=1 Tax=Citrobacter sp. wls619 TaxID=2576432 RepID=UPI0010C98782|nr:hypothetical protein [Citrobacter sp. wls619]TKV08259.1 hypothetical protein FDX19_15590 [Citrobacter sp. wls619]